MVRPLIWNKIQIVKAAEQDEFDNQNCNVWCLVFYFRNAKPVFDVADMSLNPSQETGNFNVFFFLA